MVYKYFVWEIFTAEGLELKEAHQSLLPDYWQNTKNMDKGILDILK